MKFTSRLGALAAVIAVVAAGTGTASADDISNNLDTSIDAEAELMPLNVGGANGTTTLYVRTTDGDGKNGCNFQGAETLTLNVSSSNTAVATVSPASVTFGACGDTRALTVTPVAVGSAIISAAQTANTTGDTFNLAPVTFTVNVAGPANTAPSIVVDGVTGGALYNKGAVPAATCKVTDAEDGNKSFAATLSAITGSYATDGIGTQTASCNYKDGGGLEASAAKTYSIVDPSGPVITPTVTGKLGNNGWYTTNVTLTWDVSDDDSPNSLQDTGCVDQHITSDQTSTTYTCSATSAGGSSGPVSVSIKRDATAPSVSPASVVDSTWRNTSLSETFTATDATSGLADAADASFTLTAAAESASVLAPTVDSHTVTDAAGNSTMRSVSALIDLTAPEVLPRDVNNTTWRNSSLSESFTSSDDLSGLSDGAVDASFTLTASAQSANGTTPTVATRTVYDVAGNSTERSVSALIDLTKPVITDAGTTAPAATVGDNGWYTSAVTNRFTATDALSGLAAGTSPIDVTTTTEGSAVTVFSGPVTDVAGNSAAAIPSTAFKIDLSNPTNVAFGGGPAAGSSHYFGSVPTAPTCTADDAVSGIKDCAVNGYSTAVGSHTMTATATDNAGRTATATRNYTVLGWTLNGFYQPVDMGNVFNTVKGGSTVPLKFEIFSGATELTSTSAIKSFTTAKVTCDAGAGVDEIEIVSTGGTSLRYDSTGGQYIQNWKTPTGAGVCYSATMTTLDGATIKAFFKIK